MSKEKETVLKVGNKAKGRISKRVFQESKAHENFRKNKGKKCLLFGNFRDSPFCLITDGLSFLL